VLGVCNTIAKESIILKKTTQAAKSGKLPKFQDGNAIFASHKANISFV
tara:strand:+ start:770 stop:913 length:144 start_codon:yes stop_codon:yes gene_type:complete